MRAAAVVVGVAALLVGSSASAASTGAPTAAAEAVVAAPAPAAPEVVITPTDGATDVVPSSSIRVDATGGTLTGVTVTAEDGTALAGSLSPDGHTWTSAAPSVYGTTYRFAGSAAGDGGSTPVTGGFTTVDPDRLVDVSMNMKNGAVVGIAAPIEVRFDRKIAEADRAAAERALKVSTTVPVEGSWGWLPDSQRGSRVHWRPATYWPAGTGVTVEAQVYGRDLGAAGFGGENLTTTFSIGRAQIVRADVNTHRMIIERDGQVVGDLPASMGKATERRQVTRSGVHVVLGKSRTELMTAFEYTNVPMHWAVRISNNGEFIHANPASTYAQGKRNVTHGCINLSTADARAYFESALYGDPVEVTGSSVALAAEDGDFYDWTIPYEQWKAMSALT